MPQIWVTHAELARFSKIAAAEIEAKTHVLKWPRRNCSDGQVRIKLPDDVAFTFMADAVTSQEERSGSPFGWMPPSGPQSRADRRNEAA